MNPFIGDNPGNPNDPNNQMMLMALEGVNESNMVFFLMQNPDFIEEEDQTKFRKNGVGLLRNVFMLSIAGTFLNVQMKRIPKVLSLPRLVRWPLRIPLFFSPYILLKQSFDQQINETVGLHQKYYRRVYNVKRTSDLRFFDPQGVLQKQFQKKMKQ